MNGNMDGGRKYWRTRRYTRSGQAIAELAVGLIALLVVFMGMLQIQRLAHNHTQTLMAARAQAGQDALNSPYIQRNNGPSWIANWSAGADNIPYTQDDTIQAGSPAATMAGIVARANPAALQTLVPDNALSAAASSSTLMNEFCLTHGQSTTNADIFPLIQAWVYRTDSIQLQGNAWLTWTHIE